VVQNIGPRLKYDFKRGVAAAKVRNKHFDPATRIQTPYPANRFGKMTGPAIWQLVSIDAGYHGMPQTELADRFAYVPGLVRIELGWLALTDRAKSAMPSANISQNHKCGGALAPALEYIRTSSFLTDGMQV
jgi:hypothetical protein